MLEKGDPVPPFVVSLFSWYGKLLLPGTRVGGAEQVWGSESSEIERSIISNGSSCSKAAICSKCSSGTSEASEDGSEHHCIEEASLPTLSWQIGFGWSDDIQKIAELEKALVDLEETAQKDLAE